ncbi:MAG: hypothetical protein KC516_02365 [Nanoarchaeota archaeon]|nr:hypothetical protein [Nanoarchaeota archaeon]
MEKDIGKITKNDTTEVVIRVDDFGGRPGVTIREFVTSDRYTGFTKAGVRILGTDFLKFREMINSISLDDLKSAEGSEAPKEQTTLDDEGAI